jgi:predicted nucleotidyltransferase
MKIILDNIEGLKILCMKHHVGKLFVFGSAVDDTINSESDIDLLVSFTEIRLEDYADNYFDFKFSLEDLFKRDIDLLEEKALKNPYLIQSINSAKRLVYEA